MMWCKRAPKWVLGVGCEWLNKSVIARVIKELKTKLISCGVFDILSSKKSSIVRALSVNPLKKSDSEVLIYV